MKWQDIIGHQQNIFRLQRALQLNRISHAYLFIGADGVGKAKIAQTYAAAMLCKAQEAPCGLCASCLAVAEERHLDVLMIVPEGNFIKIDQIRALKHEAGLMPQQGQKRIVIIDGADKMTVEASNSLLKLLEEPPQDFVVILLATKKDKILLTIQSRCTMVHFQPLVSGDVAAELIRRGYGQAQAESSARLSDGSMNRALALLQPEIIALREKAFALMQNIPGEMSIWENVQVLEQMETKELQYVFIFLISILRDCMLLTLIHDDCSIIFNNDNLAGLQEITGKWTNKHLICAYTVVKDGQGALVAGANTRLTCEKILLQLQDIVQGGTKSWQ